MKVGSVLRVFAICCALLPIGQASALQVELPGPPAGFDVSELPCGGTFKYFYDDNYMNNFWVQYDEKERMTAYGWIARPTESDLQSDAL